MDYLKNIKGLLFDKDGTLIDFSGSWLKPMKSIAQLVAERAERPELAMQLLIDGGYLPESDSWAKDSAIAFDTSEVILGRWSAMTSRDLIESLLPEIQDIIHRSLADAVPVIEDTAGLFSRLRSHYLLGVASMDDVRNVEQTLEVLGIHAYLDFYCGADSGHGLKPGPGMVDAFCRQTHLEPAQVAVIGDSLHDLHMASAAGAMAIGVRDGASSETTLAPHADALINHIGDLAVNGS